MSLTEENTAKFVKAGDYTIRYHEAGSGPALICLHGGGPGASGWLNFSRNIGPLAEHFQVILMDLPCYGGSDKPKITTPLSTFYAGCVRNFMDALKIDSAHLVGNSLGGGVAIKAAIDYPDRADRLVLMGPGGGLAITSAVGPSEGIRNLVNFYEGAGPTLEKFTAFVKLMVNDHSSLTEELIAQRYAAATLPGVAENFPLRVSNMKVPYEALWPKLNTIKQKTLVVWGRDDRTNTFDNALIMLNQIPDAQLHIYSKCGHWVQWEKADEFNRLVIDFLSHG